ncbi:sporulation histidine kinase inhibitor Sda [Halalkalibacter lacteus]|uniref:sporulation histidine kinase inhibitor Sda n=1 Tax=Halalkalibacter lacteus TaxID=3090663 RepID=UPI002FCA4C9B
MFKSLDNQALLEAYYEAIRLNLEIGFISILKEELDARGLTTEKPKGIHFVNRSI